METQRSFITLSSPQAGHSLAQWLSPMPSTMPDPQFVKMNWIHIPDLEIKSWSPGRSSDLLKITGFAFDGARIPTLRSPHPQTTLFLGIQRGKEKAYLILSFPCTWHAFLASSDLKELLSISFQEADKQRTLVSLGFPPSALNETTFKINGKQKPFKFQSSAKQYYGENIKQQGPTNYRPVFSPQRQIWFWKFAFGNILGMGSWKWTQEMEEGGKKDRRDLGSWKKAGKMTKTATTTMRHRIQDDKKTSDFYNPRWLQEFSYCENSSCTSWKTALLIQILISNYVNGHNRAGGVFPSLRFSVPNKSAK